MESFEQACADVAKALHIPQAADKEEDTKELVQEWLSTERAGKWLLVLDNADDPGVLSGSREAKGIVDYLPQSEEGVTVYTTRTFEVAVSLSGSDVLELGAMSQPDAADFLEKSLIRKELRDDSARGQLLEELAYLPLVIAQAAAYLDVNRMSIRMYLKLLRSTEQGIVGLMSEEFRDNTRYRGSANAVATTWLVSFRQIRERSAAAAELLEFMSCIEWKAIPRSLLPRAGLEEEMEVAIGMLSRYSFLTRREDDEDNEDKDEDDEEEQEEWYDMHRLVHLAARI
ncbi:hypothetical protein KJE20_14262 [Pyrenophora tritici-repentis]|nr:hypothetical protein KJE20_14262 [Pyrenophora tritici-repentis]